MEIKWIGSPNFSNREGYTPTYIVDHISAGTLSSMDNWFQNHISEASAHYGIGKDGSIHQYVSDDMKAWSNGIVTNPNNPITQKFGNINPNLVTLSIEHEGQTGDELTPEQYQSTLWLHRKLMQQYNIPVENVIGHYIIDPVNRSGCPGSGFPWERLKNDLSTPAWVDWKTILQKYSANPADWIDFIESISKICRNNTGSFLPALIENIYNKKG